MQIPLVVTWLNCTIYTTNSLLQSVCRMPLNAMHVGEINFHRNKTETRISSVSLKFNSATSPNVSIALFAIYCR